MSNILLVNKQTNNWTLISIISVQLLLLIGYHLDPLLVLIITGGIAGLIFTSFSVERSMVLLILYIICLPDVIYNESIPLVYNYKIIWILILGILFYRISHDVLKNHSLNFNMKGLDYPILFLLIIVCISALWGFYNNNPSKDILLELQLFLFYGIYFVARSYTKNTKQVIKILAITFIATLVVSFE